MRKLYNCYNRLNCLKTNRSLVFYFFLFVFFFSFSPAIAVTTPPVLTLPAASSYDNQTVAIDFTLPDAPLAGSVKMTFTRSGGTADPNSPHIITFDANFETMGQHTTTLDGNDLSADANVALVSSDPNDLLVHGSRYTVTISYQNSVGDPAASVSNTVVWYDIIAPTITFTVPADNSYRRTTQVSYVLSETFSTGSITWTQTGGNADPGSPHVQALTTAELATTARNNYTLTNNPVLVDGAIYTVTFDGADRAGNDAVSVVKTNVLYDVTLPVISSTTPVPNSYMNHTRVSYTLSEDLSIGEIRWTRSAGLADALSPHIQALSGAELIAGAHTDITLTNDPVLVHGTRYTVRFSGNDLAGNAATMISNTLVWYDVTAPTITFTVPADNSYRRTAQVSYVLSETFSTGSITWTQTGGNADPGSPHVQALTTAELATTARNNYTLTNNPVLVDGAIYTVTFDGADLAGNSAVSVVKTNVTYDVTLPVISSTAPVPSSYVNYTRVSYTLSENLSIGEVRWTRTGGTADGTVHIQALSGTELDAGAHNDITLVNDPTLVSGTVYTVRFSGNDLAGNAATMISNTLVTYDITAPTITFTAPADNTYRNTTQVSYVLSEIFGTGSITWTWTGGSPDVGSPHVQALTTAELATTARNNYTLTNNPVLVDGAVYSVTFEGNDRAGNTATPVVADNVTYDFTVPTILGTAPIPSSYTNNTIVSYTLSEDFVVGEIRWTRSGGVADAGSPHIQALTGTELTAGAHTNITLTNDPTLVNGTVYTVRFSGNDSAGNAATMISNTLVTYDITVPTITAAVPASDAYRTTNLVSYTLSEIFASGFITWTRTGGVADPGSPHVQALTGTELNNGAHTNITLTNNPALVDGAVYTVTFDGQDRAGNNAVSVISTNVSYDHTAPAISATTPVSSTYIDNTQVSYTLSENLASGTIRWSRTGGAADPLSPQTKALTGNELLAGVHSGITLTNDPTLTNASVYTITFNGTDFAGMTATPVANTTITFDNTTPVISATAPATGVYVKTTVVSYTLSANLMSGNITWTRTGGAVDGGSPHIQALTGTELNTGAHSNITLTNNPTLVDGVVYSITFNGTDFAGHAATPVVNTGITYDVTLPTISSTTPVPSSYTNNTKVSYTLSEDLAVGEVRWTRTGGTADGTVHMQALTGAELTAGAHNNITLTNDPTLVNGSIYTVRFSGNDFAGNAATMISNTLVTYDITVPTITAAVPASDAYRTTNLVSYTLSEIFASGFITWTRTGGVADPGSPHVQALTGTELNNGAHTNITLTNNPALVDGAVYTVTFDGQDRAGNNAVSVISTNVSYDYTAPAISATTPVSSTYIDNTQVSYTLSENLASGTIQWLRTGGTADPLSPQTKALTGNELLAGVHSGITLTNDPTLTNASVYTITFNGTDFAGMTATPVANTTITFDNTTPVISATAPATGVYVKTTVVSYTLSETVMSGNITWTRTGGAVDGGSPHIQALTGTELNTGAHSNITLTNNPTLVDGVVYSITFNGTDFAGHAATPVVNTGITYDVTLPTISSTTPVPSSYTNNTKVSYTLSEDLAVGEVQWARSGGAVDAGTPHNQALTGAELLSGTHTNITLTNDPALTDGTRYTVTFSGSDPAGNAATNVVNTIIWYDITAPVISATAPVTGSFVNSARVSYTLSEALALGTITWTRTGGAADGNSPHIKALTGPELNLGAHNNILLTNSPSLVDGATYSMMFNGTDNAGNPAAPVMNTGIIYDAVAPTITSTTPVPNSYVNHTLVSYTLSEDFLVGEVRWTRGGGAADPLSPQMQALTGAELAAGAHDNITLTNNPSLVDGAYYTVRFSGNDLAGNAATPISNTVVWYDVTLPVITFTVPDNNTIQKSAKVSYVLAETFSAASITWTRTGGPADPASPHVQPLAVAELTTTARNNYTLVNNPILVDGAIYTVNFEGADRASNNAVSVVKTNVLYDFTLPVFSSTGPSSGSYVSNTLVSYTLSENLNAGTI